MTQEEFVAKYNALINLLEETEDPFQRYEIRNKIVLLKEEYLLNK